MRLTELDENLILRTAGGDKEAFQELYVSTQDAVYGLALAMLGSRHDAEDAMHDTYLRIYSRAGGYHALGKPLDWIFRIVRELCRNRIREGRLKGDENMADVGAQADAGTQTDVGARADANTADGAPGLLSGRTALTAALNVLSREERQIVVLHSLTGLSHRDIAEILDVPAGSVLSRYTRAFRKIRALLEGNGESACTDEVLEQMLIEDIGRETPDIFERLIDSLESAGTVDLDKELKAAPTDDEEKTAEIPELEESALKEVKNAHAQIHASGRRPALKDAGRRQAAGGSQEPASEIIPHASQSHVSQYRPESEQARVMAAAYAEQDTSRADEGRQGRRKPFGLIIAIAAIVLIAAAVLIKNGALALPGQSSKTAAVVGIETNPLCLELSADKDGKVTSLDAVTGSDASAVIEEISADDKKIEGMSCEEACQTVIRKLIDRGTLNAVDNSILISVRNGDSEESGTSGTIETELASGLPEYLESTGMSLAMLLQHVEADEALQSYAGSNKMSLGKAWLINTLANLGDENMTTDTLSALETQKLMLLAQVKNAPRVTFYGQTDTSGYIKEEAAKTTAVSHAGYNKGMVEDLSAEIGLYKGSIVYEVTFSYNGSSYEYMISAESGEVLSNSIPTVASKDSYDNEPLYDSYDDYADGDNSYGSS